MCKDHPECPLRCTLCHFNWCNEKCPSFEPIPCSKRDTRPGRVCNGCPDERRCHLIKRYYVAAVAQAEYEKRLHESRQGVFVETLELKRLDGLISPRVLKGQSIHHIVKSSPGLFTMHERTLSRYLHDGLFSAKRGDLRRSCCVKCRKPKAAAYAHKVEVGCYVGRTYRDFETFRREHPDMPVVMMDLVIGLPGGKCILTIHFLEPAFMIGRLIPNKCAQSVCDAFETLWTELGPELFRALFAVILTDRGGEFSSPTVLENAPDGSGPRTRIFYCDPMNSNQKSQIERNHELLRYIFPKGTSFEALTQEKLDLALSHVNAYIRPTQNDRTPYDVFEFLRGKGVAEKLHIRRIPPEEVILKPELVGLPQNKA